MSNLASKLSWITALLLAAALPSFAQGKAAVKERVDKLAAVLKSDAGHKEKADACRALARLGTPDALAPLAALLADEKLSHMARYALEPMPGAAVDRTFRDALGKLKGRPLVGVIASLGVRRDARAVPALSKLLSDADPDVAQAAARALGRIATTAAAKAIQNALPGAPAGNQLAFQEGLFRCAESLAVAGRRADALAIYGRLLTASAPQQVRAGALRGAILLDRKNGLALLKQHLRGDDYILFAAAARAAQELAGKEVTLALAAELGELAADRQVVVLKTLARRGDIAAVPAVSDAAGKEAKAVRLAAIRALGEFAHVSAAPALVNLTADADSELAEAARESLASLPGAQVDDAIMAMLGHSEAARRLAAIELIGRRRLVTAVPALLRAARDADAKVRPAALRKLGDLATADDLSALLDLLRQAKAPDDFDAVEQALSAVCGRAANPDACTEKLTGLLAEAATAQKAALLRVLSAVGGTGALKAVRAAVNDSNAEVRTAAIRALGDWRTADAAPDLLELARHASDPTDKTLCLRSYLGLAANAEVPVEQRLTMCRQAAGLIQQPAEKKLLLGTLGGIASPDSLTLILPHLDEAEIRDEAGAAIATVADKLLRERGSTRNAPRLIAPLQQAAQAVANPDLSKRVKDLLQQAQTKAGGR